MGGARGTLATGSLVEAGLARAGRAASEQGVAVPSLRGKLLRPRTAVAFVPPGRRDRLTDRFWLGCLAVQMAHEASLHHDDVLDGGTKRRNSSSLLDAKGAGAALLAGDLCLTGSYRVALMTRSEEFLTAFTEAVETTVRGEKMQREVSARGCHADGYLEVVRAKSGALFGAAAGLAGWAGGGTVIRSARELRELGIEFGAFYQLVDDFLDYCPGDDTGKRKLQDFRNRVWTSVLGDRGARWFDLTPEEALREFFRKGINGTEHVPAVPSMAHDALEGLRARGSELAGRLLAAQADPALVDLIRGWIRRCERAARAGIGQLGAGPIMKGGSRPPSSGDLRPAGAAGAPPSPATIAAIAARAQALGPRREWGRYFARHSRSFSFAARLFAPEERRRVREIYAWCRFTDDLVDETSSPGVELHRALDAWAAICRAAYEGEATGIPLADAVMGEMAGRGIPFDLASELIEGVRMDVEPRVYRTMDELRLYTHRVASVVGAWLTYSFGVRDGWVIGRAHALGHAMQLTNIIRDVGEDLGRGRLYLPADRMAAHGVNRESLFEARARARNGRGVGAAYSGLLEEFIGIADAAYADAYEGMPHLPASFQRAVAVAAQVYQGIHDQVRANGHDNLNLRAHTSLPAKVVLARRGYGRLRAGRRRRLERHPAAPG
ncbi:MAG: squalene/phytoene synthase family protein [Gemmatimonadetes bacterium]|nr:squalene/phytoene synthase family protein [Gemmatimonadota bacterium]